MAALHIPSGGSLETAAIPFAGIGTTHWSAAFQYRVNAQPSLLMWGGFAMLSNTTVIKINPTPSGPHLYITLQCGSGYVFLDQAVAIGQIIHIALSYDAAGMSNIFIDGSSAASGSALGTSGIAGNYTVGFAPYAGADISVGAVGLWSGYTLTQADAASLASGISPSSLGTPATAYYTLAGTSGMAAVSTDAGLLNSGLGGTSYNIATVSAHYSSDVLAVNQLAQCGEAFVSRTGAFVFLRLASTFTAFALDGDNAVYDRSLMSITMSSTGSGYSNSPVATISGGGPTTPAVLGTPVVVGGEIVGIPIHSGGDGYAASGATIAITDSTGSGATAVPVIAGQPLPITAIGAAPTIKVNGSVATLNPTPIWSSATNAFSVVAYQLQTPVAAGQSVTYTLPAAWATASIGSAGAGATDAVANNYAGTLEPMFMFPAPTMNMGLNHVADPMVGYAFCSIGQDISKRFGIGSSPMTSWSNRTTGISSWIVGGNYNELPLPAGPTAVFTGTGGSGAVATCAITGGVIQSVAIVSGGTVYPSSGTTVAFTGGGGGGGATATCTVSGGAVQSVSLTSGGAGYCDGIYTLQWDDTAPQGSGPYTPTTTITLSETADGTPKLYVTPIASLSSAGTMSGGVLTGITDAYYVQYRPSAAYSYGAAIGMTFTGGSGTGPYTNTAYNAGGAPTWICTPPNNVPNRSNPVEPDQAIRDFCRFTAGVSPKVPGTIRYMDSTLPSGADCNARNPVDVTQLSDDSYNRSTPYQTASVVALRPYGRSTSPHVYVEGPSPGAVFTSGGSPTQYAIPATFDGWLNVGGGPTTLCEMVTAAPHGYGTCQVFSNNISVPASVAFSNGQLGSSLNPPILSDIPGYNNALYSTGTNTFLCQYGVWSPTSSATMPVGVNNIPFTQGVTGSISNNAAGGVSIGAAGSGYAPGATVALAPPSGAWQTALAVATASIGSVSSLAAVAGYAGNNYALAPPVTIQPPALTVATAMAACTISGGVVQTPVLTYPGYGYAGSAAVTFWGGGGTGATATATVSGGKVTGFTGFSGGSGYTGPPTVLIAPPASQAAATCTVSGGAVTGYTLAQAGSNYLTVAIAGDGTGATAVAWTTHGTRIEASIAATGNYGVAVAGVGLTSGGSGYTHATATISGGGGTGATATCTVSGGAVTGIILTSGGTNYIPNYAGSPSVVVGPPAQPAIVSATLSGGAVTGFNIIYGGSGYGTTAPEVVVFGRGSGASGTAVLAGGVVTSVTLVSGGSGYTGTNPIAVSVAPPPRQAVAVAAAAGGVQGAYVADPGCGYTNTPPAATVVGSGGGATATASMVYPFTAYVAGKSGGCIPYEVAAGFNASLPGCGCWINIPQAATDALIEAIINSVAAYLPSGQKIWVEYSNEHWNTGFTYTGFAAALGNMTGLDRDSFYCGRSASVHAVCESVLSGLGRAGDLVRVFGSWLVDGDTNTERIVAYANANNIRIDALCIGPYWDIPEDPDIISAFASIVADNPLSIAHGTSWETSWRWSRAMAHDFLRHAIISDTRYTGTGTGGAPVGWIRIHKNVLANYVMPSGQTVPPMLVAYEASIERYAPYGMGDNNSFMHLVERDLFYDPGMYDTENAFFLMNQAGGIEILNYFQLQDEDLSGLMWQLIFAEGQQPGRGDGTDGRATNLYWMEDNTIPGAGSTAAKYTTFFDRHNNSPSLRAWRDWGAKVGATTPAGTFFRRAFYDRPGSRGIY